MKNLLPVVLFTVLSFPNSSAQGGMLIPSTWPNNIEGRDIKLTVQDSVLNCIENLNDGKEENIYKVKLVDIRRRGLIRVGGNYISMEWKEKDKQKTTFYFTVLATGEEWSWFRQENMIRVGVPGSFRFQSKLTEEPVWQIIAKVLEQNRLQCW